MGIIVPTTECGGCCDGGGSDFSIEVSQVRPLASELITVDGDEVTSQAGGVDWATVLPGGLFASVVDGRVVALQAGRYRVAWELKAQFANNDFASDRIEITMDGSVNGVAGFIRQRESDRLLQDEVVTVDFSGSRVLDLAANDAIHFNGYSFSLTGGGPLLSWSLNQGGPTDIHNYVELRYIGAGI